MLSPKTQSQETSDFADDNPELELELDEVLRERYQQIKDEEKTADPVEQLKKLRESANFWDDEFTE